MFEYCGFDTCLKTTYWKRFLTQNFFSPQSRSKLFTTQGWKGQTPLVFHLWLPSTTSLSTSTWFKTFSEMEILLFFKLPLIMRTLCPLGSSLRTPVIYHICCYICKMNFACIGRLEPNLQFFISRRFCHIT